MVKALLKRTRRQDGFTLIELIVVVAILGILAAVVTPRVLDAVDNAKQNSALAFGKEIQLAMERYYLENESGYPAAKDMTKDDEVVAKVGKFVALDTNRFDLKSYESTATDDYTLVLDLTDSKRTLTISPGDVSAVPTP